MSDYKEVGAYEGRYRTDASQRPVEIGGRVKNPFMQGRGSFASGLEASGERFEITGRNIERVIRRHDLLR